MAVLTAASVISQYTAGGAAMLGLYALRDVSTGDTIDLSVLGAPAFQVIKSGVVLGQSAFVEIAATFTGTVVTMPSGLSHDCGYLLVWGCLQGRPADSGPISRVPIPGQEEHLYMAHTPVRCEHDSIKWYPRVTVEKYSPDQTAWAQRRLHDELSWGRRLLVETLGIRVPELHGDWLREVFREPEDGYAYCEGNSLVNGGLDALGNLLAGTGTPQALVAGKAICGVGSNAAAFAVTQAALSGDGSTSTAWYQAMDATYPHVDGTTHGQLDGQSTFIGTSANFATGWVEWCWASATTTVGGVTGGTLAGLSGTCVMLNRWTGTTLGTKGAGATWIFSSTVTFS